MATPLEVRVIDPSQDALVALLDRATRRANGRLRAWRVKKDVADWRRFVQRHATAREGHHTFEGTQAPVGAARVAAAWWTDPLGRKHWRIHGGRATVVDRRRRSQPLAAHPVWHVYPGRLVLREVGGEQELVALCGCGEAGPLDAIRWLGTSCGPCHDRREDGDPYAGPMHPAEVPGDGGEVRLLAIAGDGRLVSGTWNGRAQLWDPATGKGRSLICRHSAPQFSLRVSSAGVVALTTRQSQVAFASLDDDPPQWRVHRVAGCGHVREMAFTPDGRSLLVFGTGGLFLLDPAGATPPRVLSRGRTITNVGFLDDGRLALAFDQEAGVVRLDLATGERVAVDPRRRPPERREQRDWMPAWCIDSGFQGHFSARSPDGQWLACEGRWVDSPRPHLYHIPTGRWLPLPGVDCLIPPVVGFSRRGELLTLHLGGTLAVWDVNKRTLVGKLQLESLLDTTAFALSPDGEYLATAADDRGTVRLWPWRRLLGSPQE